MGIEHNIVRSAQLIAVALGINRFHRPGVDIGPLDITVGITLGNAVRHGQPAGFYPLKAAVITHVALAVGSNRRAVWPATRFGHDFLGSIRFDPRQRAALDLGQDDAAVIHGNRAFGKFQAGGYFSYLCHICSPFIFPPAVCSTLRPGVSGSVGFMRYGPPCPCPSEHAAGQNQEGGEAVLS